MLLAGGSLLRGSASSLPAGLGLGAEETVADVGGAQVLFALGVDNGHELGDVVDKVVIWAFVHARVAQGVPAAARPLPPAGVLVLGKGRKDAVAAMVSNSHENPLSGLV